MMNFAATTMADTTPEKAGEAKQPRVRVVFMRPDVERSYMGWPGASYDYKARQADYTKVMQDAAEKDGVELDITHKPFCTKGQTDALLKECESTPPQGVIVVVMNLNDPWPEANRFVAKRPADIPVIVFSPMGTSFTQHLQETRSKPKTFVAATQKFEWLAEGVHMMRTIWDMDRSRLCIMNGKKTVDEKLKVIGTTLHRIPLARWTDEWKAIGYTDEMKEMAAFWKKIAKKTVEPNDQDILNAAQTYAVAKRIMAAENCDGISLNCLGLVGDRKIPWSAVHGLVAAQRRGERGLLRMRLASGHHASADQLPLSPTRLHAGPVPQHNRGHVDGRPLQFADEAGRLRPTGRDVDPPQPQRVGDWRFAPGDLAAGCRRDRGRLQRPGQVLAWHGQGRLEHQHPAGRWLPHVSRSRHGRLP